MGTPFLAELKIVSFGFVPEGWAQTNGQFLGIAQNQALFSILGTTYGGDGQVTFRLPDMRSRMPLHRGQATGGPTNYALGQTGGAETRSLSTTAVAVGSGVSSGTGQVARSPASLQGATRAPFLTLNYIIALEGVFPSTT